MRSPLCLASALLVALLGGCGGDSTDAPVTPAQKRPVAESGAVELAGTPMPEALANFRCEPAKDGWIASGSLTNTGKQTSSLQVTVFVGLADDTSRPAVTRRFADLAPGKSTDFTFERIRGQGSQCRVQVLSN